MNSLQEKLVLGTVQLGLPYGINNQTGKPSEGEAFLILDLCEREGIRYLDTAESYGESEQIIGSYFLKHPNHHFKILTKFKSNEASLKKQLSSSLERLGVCGVYGYSYHQFSDVHDLEKKHELLDLKNGGLIQKIGVSVYTVEELDAAALLDHIDIIQTPFNLFDNWSLRGPGIRRAKANKKEVHVRSVFLQGLFYRELELLPEMLKPLKPELLRLRELSKQMGLPVNHLALAYASHFEEIDRIIIGVESQRQLMDNLSVQSQILSPGIIDQISSIQIENPKWIDPRAWK